MVYQSCDFFGDNRASLSCGVHGLTTSNYHLTIALPPTTAGPPCHRSSENQTFLKSRHCPRTIRDPFALLKRSRELIYPKQQHGAALRITSSLLSSSSSSSSFLDITSNYRSRRVVLMWTSIVSSLIALRIRILSCVMSATAIYSHTMSSSMDGEKKKPDDNIKSAT